MSSWTSKLAAGLLVVAALSRPSAGAPQAASSVNASSLGSALPSSTASMPTSVASDTPTSTAGVDPSATAPSTAVIDPSAAAPSSIAAPASSAGALSLVSAPGTSPVSAAVRPPQGPPPDLASSDDVPYPPLPADWNTVSLLQTHVRLNCISVSSLNKKALLWVFGLGLYASP